MWLLKSRIKSEGKKISLPILKARLIESGYSVHLSEEKLILKPSSIAKKIGFWGGDLLLSNAKLFKRDSEFDLVFSFNVVSFFILFFGCFGAVFFMMSRSLQANESLTGLAIMFSFGLLVLVSILLYSAILVGC